MKRREEIKTILALSVPIMLENVLQTLLGTVDTYFAGQLSDNAIAGIGVTNLVMNIFISFFTAVSVGTTAIVSRGYGKKAYEKVNQAILHCQKAGIMLGLGSGVICMAFSRPILALSGAEEEVLEYALPYFGVVAVPAVFLCLQLILSSCLRAVQDTKTPMYVTGISNLINIGLNFIFIKMGLGVLGLGLATTLSRGIGAAILWIRLYQHDRQICPRWRNYQKDSELTKSILRVGLPAGAEKLIMRIGQLIYNGMIISLGTASYVAHSVGGTIESYSYIPAMGLGLAVSNLVGLYLGEEKPQKAKETTYLTYGIAAGIMILFGVIFYLFAPQLAAGFTNTKRVQELVVSVLRIIAFFQPFSALTQIMTNALQGAGDTKYPMYSTLIGIWGIRLGIGYMLAVPAKMGLQGVWLAYGLDLTARGLLLLHRFHKNRWQTVKL